jgi:hypothetical protein
MATWNYRWTTLMQKRVYVVVEGKTESIFVAKVLSPYFAQRTDSKLMLYPTQNETSSGYKGGVVSYKKLIDNISTLSKLDSSGYITTFIDYYGLSATNFPHYTEVSKKVVDVYEKVARFEKQIGLDVQDICGQRFIPYIQLHEFEALYFADYERFLKIDPMWNETHTSAITAILHKANYQPELINDNPDTAPSKRLQNKLCYSKVHHSGIFASYLEHNNSINLAVEKMSETCPHFNQWLEKLLKLVE